jgi:hypothetical protein
VKAPRSALSVAIDAYRRTCRKPLAVDEGRMLDRLTQSKDAAKAFAELDLSEAKGRTFINDCVQAHRFDQGEHTAQMERLRHVPDLKKMQAKLESLVKDFGALTEDVEEAFRVISVELYYRRLHHGDDLLSTSRKGDKTSARSRAIGWLKESVRRLSGQPNQKPLMTLCDVVLNTAEPISLDALKRAVTPTEWLDRRRRNKGVRVRGKKKR